MYHYRDELKALGVKMACVFRENIPKEVAAFREDVWKGEPMFLDHQFQFFSAIAGGKPNEKTIREYMESVKNPSPQDVRNRERSMALADGFMTPEHHNMVGQGLMTGGVYVLHRGGAVEFAHHETFGGDTAEAADILGAARRVASSSKL